MVSDDPRRSVSPRVLIILNTCAGWSRGILRGFVPTAHARGWTLLHYHLGSDLDWLAREFQPAAVVIGPGVAAESLPRLAPAPVVSVAVDHCAEGIASVCLDELAIAALAAKHLVAVGLRQVTTFRFSESAFAIARERAFVQGARAAGASVAVGWGSDEAQPIRRAEDPAEVVKWLRTLPRPCGIFACTDRWGRIVARYARAAGLRVPEDLALVGADNDILECELIAPPLSSVIIPWQEVGRSAAELVQWALSGQTIAGKRLVVEPMGLMARRSSDVLAIEDPLVATAVLWIREHVGRRLNVPVVARAVGGGRQRLERRFRGVLDRSVVEEIRRARVEAAKELLETTRAGMAEVAKRVGFTNPAVLSAAFQRELGMPPGRYRRRMQEALRSTDDGTDLPLNGKLSATAGRESP